ncbi:MAG: DUF3037 domain-containing protein [Chloroflexia bacterium]|nr:DUF3037 domain-containing protein [Chloroflexia bacterium]
MATSFTIIQVVPDPIADERMNVGVVVFGGGEIRSRFVTDWRAVSNFAREDIDYLRDFARRFGEATETSTITSRQVGLDQEAWPHHLTEEKLQKMIGEWSNSIQFSPQQATLEPPDTLLAKLTAIYLRDPDYLRSYRDRRAAVRLAVATARHAVEGRLGKSVAKKVVRSPYELSGHIVRRLKLDMAVKNSRVYVATQALSFESLDLPKLEDQATRALHVLNDVGNAHRDIRLETLVLPPNPTHEKFRDAQQRFLDFQAACDRIGVQIIQEDEAPVWAERIADIVEAEIVPHLHSTMFT